MVTRADSTLYDVQCQLNASGASELVVNLVINSSSSSLFLETVQLGIALLEGGNGVIQVSSDWLIRYHGFWKIHVLSVFRIRFWPFWRKKRTGKSSSKYFMTKSKKPRPKSKATSLCPRGKCSIRTARDRTREVAPQTGPPSSRKVPFLLQLVCLASNFVLTNGHL